MPEMTFDVRWPDGETHSFYSPSLIVEDYFESGSDYTVADFVDRSRTCMRIADERVRAKYGFGCAASRQTMARIEQLAGAFAPTDTVTLRALRR